MILSRFALAALLLTLSAPAVAQASTATPKVAPTQQWLGTISLARTDLLDPARWSDQEIQTRASHFNYWQRLTKAGSVILVGRTLDEDAEGHLAPDAVGLIVFEAPNRPAAERMLADDPGVAGGLWRYKLQSYRVALTR